ncbi:MAG: LysR family transcriptional regulator [Parasporobacterium sp.]|nr:LysR family transcriptional regulator [Parasporobacterium sp.]
MHNIDIRNINIGQLQCFAYTVEFNSFTKAAEQLHITQSTVSKAIISMENMMGLQLFIRNGNRIQTTPAGRYVYSQIKRVGNDIEKTLFEASVIQTGLSKNIRIACLDTHKPDSVLLPFVNFFKRAYPDIKIAVETMPAEDIRTALINGETDVAFTVLYDIDMLGDDFDSILIGESPHYVYMLKSNPLARRRSIRIEELKQSEFISISPLKTPSYSTAVNLLCEEKGFQPNITYFTQNASSLTFNLTTENEVFIADRFYKDFDNPMIVAVPIKDTKSGIVMGYKKDNTNHVLSLFLEKAEEYLEKHQI